MMTRTGGSIEVTGVAARVALLIAALVVAGCGGSSHQSGAALSPATPSTAPPAGLESAALTMSSVSKPSAPIADPAPIPESVQGDSATYRYGPDPAHLLDVTGADSGPDEFRPAIVYLASGGWMAQSRPTVPDFVTAQMERGWAVVAVDFRLSPAHVHPEPSRDVDRALRWLRVHGQSVGVDADRLVLVGASSGGNLALLAAADPGRFTDSELPLDLAAADPAPAAVVSVAGPSDLVVAYEQVGTWMHSAITAHLGCDTPCTDGYLAAASPIDVVRPTPPPALLFYGELDTFIPVELHGEPLSAAWAAAGGVAIVSVGAGAGHNLSFELGIDETTFNRFLDSISAG